MPSSLLLRSTRCDVGCFDVHAQAVTQPTKGRPPVWWPPPQPAPQALALAPPPQPAAPALAATQALTLATPPQPRAPVALAVTCAPPPSSGMCASMTLKRHEHPR